MKPSEMFEVCHERYLESQVTLGIKINAINPAASAKGAPQYVLPRVTEYVADFELAGLRAIRRKGQKNAMAQIDLFTLHFCQKLDYALVKKLLWKRHGTKPETVDVWVHRIKGTIGAELARSGIFPPSSYFREPTWITKRKQEERDELRRFDNSPSDPGDWP